jgi:hypothetical protein
MASPSKTTPERHGKRWEDDEVQYVLARVKQGKWPAQIAVEVKRTTGGIVSRLKEIAYDSVKNKGMTVDAASELTGLAAEQINDHIKQKDLVEALKEEKKARPAEPKQQLLRPFFLGKQEETVLEVVIEIRDLLRELVKSNQTV